jgi:hypothetical protein
MVFKAVVTNWQFLNRFQRVKTITIVLKKNIKCTKVELKFLKEPKNKIQQCQNLIKPLSHCNQLNKYGSQK